MAWYLSDSGTTSFNGSAFLDSDELDPLKPFSATCRAELSKILRSF